VRSNGGVPLDFVGSATVEDDVEKMAARIRDKLAFDVDARSALPTWTEALRQFIAQVDACGVLVMCSGVVLNNNRRPLDPGEFRGFALPDPLAPLVFINGADTKAAQMFTLAHELAHVWLGQAALSDAEAASLPTHAVERWCNRVAAELLVPLTTLRNELRRQEPLDALIPRLTRRFKVSSLVILRRLSDIGRLTRTELRDAYDGELARLSARGKSSGGDFYLTQAVRVSKRFARALVASTLEGQTLYRDAMQMLGISKMKTFHELGVSLKFGV
jgi:Zn-dependent peptidase ImmA (M78 family)